MIFEQLKDMHIEEAAQLSMEKYHCERQKVAVLPNGDFQEVFCLLIGEKVSHGLGVCAIDDGKLVGFMTCTNPIGNFFGSFPGVFSPIHAHGTIHENSGKIYSLLYQQAAKKWVNEGIFSHAIALYAHDEQAEQIFFSNSFGLRCIDAIRKLRKIPFQKNNIYIYSGCGPNDLEAIADMENQLIYHLRGTPMFMPRNPNKNKDFIIKSIKENGSRFFLVKLNDKPVGFLEICDEGETFISKNKNMKNICGAYLLPEHRSNGVFSNLLSYTSDILKKEGYSLLGVDYESFNPPANAFWQKYFVPYTHSVTRRIDERIYPGK